MSIHQIASDPTRLLPFLRKHGRAPSSVIESTVDGSHSLEFTPDLTPAETTMLADVDRLAALPVWISRAEWAILEPTFVQLKAFRTRTGTPTNAQTLATIDNLIDVLRALLRD